MCLKVWCLNGISFSIQAKISLTCSVLIFLVFFFWAPVSQPICDLMAFDFVCFPLVMLICVKLLVSSSWLLVPFRSLIGQVQVAILYSLGWCNFYLISAWILKKQENQGLNCNGMFKKLEIISLRAKVYMHLVIELECLLYLLYTLS